MNFLNQIKVLHRFLLLAAIGIVIAAIPTAFFVRDRLILMDTLKMEQQGLLPIRTSLNLTQLIQRHRGLSARLLSGDLPARENQTNVAQAIDKKFIELSAQMPSFVSPQLLSELQTTQSNWTSLREKLASKTLSAQDSFTAHSGLIISIKKVANRVTEQSGLDLDSTAESHHLIVASVDALWPLSEALAKARGVGVALIINKSEEPMQLLALGLLVTDAENFMELMAVNFDGAFTYSQNSKIRLNEILQGTVQATKNANIQSRALIMASARTGFSSDSYFSVTSQAVDKSFDLMESTLSMVDVILADRITDAKRILYMLLGVFLVLLVLATTYAWLIARSLTRQLGGEPNDMVQRMLRVAQGDLTAPIPSGKMPENSIMQSMVLMQSNLQKMVQEVRSGAEHMVNASSQIAAGNMDLSERTERQASALEQTSSSTEQLMGTVRQNADNSSQANELAVKASQMVVHGGDQVAKVVSTMDGINQSSRKIIDIISVIDGIAFQTNILALNAAVEAARAGEQGRGFAVVASEVRNLAQRSAVAAKEIKVLIGDSIDKVEEGSRQVALTGAAMDEVVASVKRVTLIMSEVNTASHEQTAGIEQVNQAINQMEQITQQNAALVEEAAAASDELKHQARGLQDLVSRFQLPGDAARAAVPRLTEPYVAPTESVAMSLKRLGGGASGRQANLRQNGAQVTDKPMTAGAVKSDDWEEF